MKFNSYKIFGGGYNSFKKQQKGGQAIGNLPSMTSTKGGQRYSLNIGGNSYGC